MWDTSHPRKHVRDHADCNAGSGNMSYRSHRSAIYLPCLKDLDREVGTDDANHLSEVWKIGKGSTLKNHFVGGLAG